MFGVPTNLLAKRRAPKKIFCVQPTGSDHVILPEPMRIGRRLPPVVVRDDDVGSIFNLKSSRVGTKDIVGILTCRYFSADTKKFVEGAKTLIDLSRHEKIAAEKAISKVFVFCGMTGEIPAFRDGVRLDGQFKVAAVAKLNPPSTQRGRRVVGK